MDFFIPTTVKKRQKNHHLKIMEKAQNILKKYIKWISGISIGLYGIYIFYVLLKELDKAKDVISFGRSIWTYQIYTSGGVSITLNKIILGLTIVSMGILVAKYIAHSFIHKILEKTSISISSKATIENVVFYSISFLFFIISMNVIQVPLTIFTVFGGALAIGVGFGSQNLLNNFISGLIIQIEKPVKVGDIIELDETTKGVVQEIGTRSTKILLSDNSHVIIPNSVFLEKKFINLTLQDETIRSKISLSLSYKHDPEDMVKLCKDVLKEFPEILSSPEPRVLVSNFGSSGIDYSLFFFMKLYSQTDKSLLESNVRIKLYKVFKEKGIEIPFQTIQIIQK